MSLTKATSNVLAQDTAIKNIAEGTCGGLNFRNKIINGGMEIDQRNDGDAATITAGEGNFIGVYSVDRWYGFCAGANVTHQRTVVTAPRVSYLLRVTGATGCTTTWVAQRIESSNAAQLAGIPVTLSFYAASNTLTQIQVGYGVVSSNTPDDWSAGGTDIRQTINITPTLTRYNISFTMPAAAYKGAYVAFYSNGPLTAGQNFDITGVQLEEGTVATPFERRPIGLELSLCQRYFHIFDAYALDSYPYLAGASCFDVVRFPVRMRAIPTLTSGTITYVTNGGTPQSLFTGITEKQALWSSAQSGQTAAGGFGAYNLGVRADAEL